MAGITISNITANAALWIPYEPVTISFKLKNETGKKITDMVLQLALKRSSFSGESGGSDREILLHRFLGTSASDGETINLADGKSKTFSATFNIPGTVEQYFNDYPDIRAVPMYITGLASQSSSIWGIDFEISDLRVMNTRFNPRITEMELVRSDDGAPNDEGESVLTTLKLAIDSAGYDYSRFFTAKVYQSQGDNATTADAYTDLTGSIENLLAGVESDPNILTGTYSKAYDWDFLLAFGDEYETFYGRFNLGRAFANMHLSGVPTGGVCFGGFCSSKYGNPKLQSYYPIQPFNGIEAVKGGAYTQEIDLDADAPFVVRSDNPLQPTLRAFGNVVEIQGELQPTKAITGSTTYYPIFTIPEQYAPDHDVVALQQGSTQEIWMLRIFSRNHAEHPCKVMFSRYRDGANWADTTASTWLPFHAVWCIDGTISANDNEALTAMLLDAEGSAVQDANGSDIAVLSETGGTYQSRYTGDQIDAGVAAANNALPRSGGTMTGALYLSADPTEATQPATKRYVDKVVGNIQLTPGADGKSAYEIALEQGFDGTEAEWIASLHGQDGYTPVKGTDYFDGKDGADGKSAYEYAAENGYTGTEAEFGADLNKAIEGGGDVAWSEITGKPFGNPITGSVTVDGDTLKWDGNTDGMHTVAMVGMLNGLVYASNDVPTLEQLKTGCVIQFKNTSNGNQYEYALTPRVWNNSPNVITLYRYIGDVDYTFAYVALVDGASFGSSIFDRAGVYYDPGLSGYIMELTVPGYSWTETTEIGPIPDKYIPDTIARAEDVNEQVSDLDTRLTASFEADIAETNQSVSELKTESEASDLDIRHDIEALRDELYDFYDEALKEVVWREDAEYGDVIHDNWLDRDMVRVSAYVPKLGGLGTDTYWYVRTNTGTAEAIPEYSFAGDYSGTFCISSYYVWVIAEDNTTITNGGVTTVYPKKGTYFPIWKDIYGNQFVLALYSTIMQAQEESITLKPEHLPELDSFIMVSTDGSKRFRITIDSDGEFIKTAL